MRQVKENRMVLGGHQTPMTMAEFVARRLRDVDDIFSDFLNSTVTLIPIPRSSLRHPGALWPAQAFAQALVDQGHGLRVLECLHRTKAVPKAALAPSGSRPRASTHRESLSVVRPREMPATVTLIDDVITRGAQVMGAALALWRVYPSLTIRAFVVLRTISQTCDFNGEILAPVVGVVALSNGETSRYP